eukprot:4023726-Pyramimonas_sp.AAC.1
MSRVSEKFKVVNVQTSDEVARDFCELYSEMLLFEVEWDPVDVDGTLLWAEVKAATPIGCLWKAGLKVALGTKTAPPTCPSSSILKKMKSSDPLMPDHSKAMAKTSSKR